MGHLGALHERPLPHRDVSGVIDIVAHQQAARAEDVARVHQLKAVVLLRRVQYFIAPYAGDHRGLF